MAGVDDSVLRVTVILFFNILRRMGKKYTIHVWFGFRQVACGIGGVTRVRGLLEYSMVMTRLLNNLCSRPVNVVNLRS